MLDIKFIKENKDVVAMAMKNKKTVNPVNLDELIAVYDERKAIKAQIDDLNQKKNEFAKTRNIEEGMKVKKELPVLEAKYADLERRFMIMMLPLPNIPSADTPIGPDESGNKVLRQVGEKPKFTFKPKEHWEIGKTLDIIDNDRASLVTGSRFTYLKDELALMQFALIQLAFEIVTNEETLKQIIAKAGIQVNSKPFRPIIPPVFVKPEVLNRMARLEPRDERYHTQADNLYLVGSAEHTLGPIHMDEILSETELPIRYAGYSTAFRREAGSYGKDTKGILRMHQFDKLEMETFCTPETSYQEQDLLVAIQEYMMKLLGIAYQVVICCTGDMGDPDHRHIDIETWMPGQNVYRETHSSDLMTSYQTRRLNTRFKRKEGKAEFVHTNDATLFAIGRTLIAIIENYQQEDGSIKIPEILQKYMGGRTVITKNLSK